MSGEENLKKPAAWLSKSWFWLLAVMFLALIARLYHITYLIDDMHAFKQTANAGLIRDYYRHGINILYPTKITLGKPGYMVQEFPLYTAVAALLYKLFTPDIIVARFFTIFTGLVSIFFVYRISSRFLDKKSSVFAALCFAFMPLDIFFQRTPMQDPLTVLFSLAMLDFLIGGITGKNVFLILGILAASLGFMMKSPFVAPLFLPVFYLAWSRNKKIGDLFAPRLLLSFLVPFVVMVIWQRHANFVNETYVHKDAYPFNNVYPTIVVTLHPFNSWYFGTLAQRLDPANYLTILRRLAMYVLTPMGTVFFAIGAIRLAKKEKESFAFLLVWLISLCLVAMMAFNLFVVHNYYLLPFCPVLSIFCGAGGGYLMDLLNKFTGKTIAAASAAIIATVFLLAGFSISKYFYKDTLYSYFGTNFLAEIGNFIHQNTETGKLVAIVYPSDHVNLSTTYYPVPMYYADRHGFVIPLNMMNGKMLDYMRSQHVKYLAKIAFSGLSGYDLTTRIFDISGGKPVLKASCTASLRPG